MTGPHVYFDEHIAARYDADSADRFDPGVLGPTVDFLADQASRRPSRAGSSGIGAPGVGSPDTASALEFAVGTGRVALPLSSRGVRVQGIELSEAMAAQLRAKPGADRVPVTIGDMATTRLDERFDLVYLVFNTITNLTTQDEQVACFQNAAAHLRPGGRFVVEVFVPILQRLPPGEVYRTFYRTPTRLGFDEYDVVTQILYSHHYRFEDDGTYQVDSAPYRYVWPAELDLMARLAGLGLRERWAGWAREPFTSSSDSHVSVWEAPS